MNTFEWETTRLRSNQGRPIVFMKSIKVRASCFQEKSWMVELPEFQISSMGPDLMSTLGAIISQLREETMRLVQSMSHRLSPEERLRKQLLLGSVDIITSDLHAPNPKIVWVCGNLDRFEGRLVFRTLGGSRHDLTMTVHDELQFDRLRFAMFNTDSVGRPCGPVLTLEEPL